MDDNSIRNDGRLRLDRNLQSESAHFNLIEASLVGGNPASRTSILPVKGLQMDKQRSLFERISGADVGEHAKWIGQAFSDVISRWVLS